MFKIGTTQQVIWYVLVPLFIILIIFGTILLITSRKKNEMNTKRYNYKASIWSCIIAILFGAMILAVALGFAVSFIQQMRALELIDKYFFLYIVAYIFPLFPFAFLVYFIVKFIKVLRKGDLLFLEEQEKEGE